MIVRFESPAQFWLRRRLLFPDTDHSSPVSDLVSLFMDRGVRSVADFGAGPGDATLAFRRFGMTVLAVDRDVPSMRRLAHMQSLSPEFQVHVGDWRQVGHRVTGGQTFDAVCCRGNALIYADSWETGQLSAGTTSMVDSLQSMWGILRRKGICYIDITSAADLQRRSVHHVVGARDVRSGDVTIEWYQQVEGQRRILDARRTLQTPDGSLTRETRSRLVSYAFGVSDVASIAAKCGFAVEATGAILPNELVYEGILLSKP